MRHRAARAMPLIGAVLAAVTVAGCSNGSGNSSSTTATTRPASSTSTSATTAPSSTSTSAAAAGAPCTQSAILSAAQAATNLGAVQSVVNFGCAGSWAYANVTVGTGAAAFDAVVVLQAQGSDWQVADRATACNNHLVPTALYTQACTTS